MKLTQNDTANDAAQRCKVIADGVKEIAKIVAELLEHQAETPKLNSAEQQKQNVATSIFRSR